MTSSTDKRKETEKRITNGVESDEKPPSIQLPSQAGQIFDRTKLVIVFISGILFAFFAFFLHNRFSDIKLLNHHITESNFLQVGNDVSLMTTVFDIQLDSSKRKESVRDVVEVKHNEQEALNSVELAREMCFDGKADKALRLFQHAIALAPKHPDILTRYGEFLEHEQKDVIAADEMYTKALIISPGHETATINRRRTSHVVERLDQQFFKRLDEKRDALSGIHETNPALRRAKKEAYIQHIYHSVGIEGNTMSLAQTRSVLETRMAVEGKSVDEHNEILGLDSAMKFINATLVNKIDLIRLTDILEMHKRIFGHVNPVEGGVFRETQVYVGSHIPPGPGELRLLMDRFESWLNSEYALSLHPIRYASLAHYKLVELHPFSDGNGRSARLLMNLILMRAGYPPIIIQKHQRHKYYTYLQIANEGDPRPFIRFIADCTERTLDLYLWATSDLSHPIPLLTEGDTEGKRLISEFVEMDDREASDTIRI